MAKDTTEVRFFIAVDENGKFGVDSERESARDELCGRTEGDCMDLYEVTMSVPKAMVRKVHAGALKVEETERVLKVTAIEAA
jgi:hypothetical protein